MNRLFPDSTRAIELDPSLAVAYFSRARARCGLGDFDGAVIDFDKVI